MVGAGRIKISGSFTMIKDSCLFLVSFWVGLVVFVDSSSPSSTPCLSNIPSHPTLSKSAIRIFE